MQRKNTGDHIHTAVQAGQRNEATVELVRNWCRHARIRRLGRGGLVEEATGLPIGHVGMACEHAVASGILSWDLADAAVDFHDRNCSGCVYREPVGLPNLATLVAERDARRERAEEELRSTHDRLLEDRAKRRAVRRTIRARLPPLSTSLIDSLEEIDQDTPGDAAERFLATARLAPEIFTREVTEYLFSQLESSESWFAEAGLRVLLELNADPKRLTSCALRSLSVHPALAVAGRVVELNAEYIDPDMIADALPALSQLANPERMPFADTAKPDPGPLRAVHKAQGAPLEAAIDSMLSERDPRNVSLAAGAIEVLSRTDRGIVRRFTRALAAKLRGAAHLIDERQTGFSGDDECIHRLKNVLALALRYAPNEADALLGNFLEGARDESELRLYQVYGLALSGGRDRRRRTAKNNPAAPLALKRLLDGLKSDNPEVLSEIQSTLSYNAGEHRPLARREFKALLGSAMLLDDVLKRLEAGTPKQQSVLERLELDSQRRTWRQLQDTLLEWASTAAKGSAAHTAEYVEVLNRLPEDRDELRSAFISSSKHFMETPEGLSTMLPTLYTSMVGTSIRLRSQAAELLGELRDRRHENAPNLVHEAFAVLLADPYVWVHKAAVRALKYFKLPNEVNPHGKAALVHWIMVYAGNAKDDGFLLECLHLYWRRYASDRDKNALGKLYVKALQRMKVYEVVNEIRDLRHDLGDVEGFAALAVRLLSDPQLSEHQTEDLLDTLADLSSQAIRRNHTGLVEAASRDVVSPFVAIRVAEILSNAGAWQEAAQVAEALYQRIPTTTEYRPVKLQANLWHIATKFEEALSQGKLEDVSDLASKWRLTEVQIEEDQAKHAKQRHSFPVVPVAH